MATINDRSTLLALVKRDQDKTWVDEATEDKLSDIIEEAIPYLYEAIGQGNIDFTQPGPDRMLFKAYCLYAVNKMSDEFASAYSRDITARRNHYSVLRRMASE